MSGILPVSRKGQIAGGKVIEIAAGKTTKEKNRLRVKEEVIKGA